MAYKKEKSGKRQIKRICFDVEDESHVNLLIRLRYDELKQAEFFRGMVNMYINRDPRMLDVVSDIKQQSQTRKTKIVKIEKLKGETNRKFALDKEEIENIFDVLEQEFPDL